MSNGTRLPWTVMRHPVAGVTDVVLRATRNLYELFGAGPAGATTPSRPNWSTFY